MFRKAPLPIRNFCWFLATSMLFLSIGWLSWTIWFSVMAEPQNAGTIAVPLALTLLFLWARRRTHRVIGGPLYHYGFRAYLIGQMRHT